MGAFLSRPDGCRLYYEVHGPGDAPALVLLEGLGGDVPGWRRNLPHLSARYRVVAFDARGNGRSTMPPGPATMRTFAEDALALLDALDGPVGDAHLYGQSFGGMVALAVGLWRPERVRSLVLAATHAGAGRASPVGGERSVPKDRPYLALYSEEFARAHPDHVAEDLAVGARNPQRPDAGRRQWEAVRDWDVWDELARLSPPTMILHGSEDRMVSVENARRMAAAIAGARLVVLEGAGHVYHSERAEEADAAVLAFLDAVEADRGDP